MTSDVWMKSPLPCANCVPERFEILEYTKVPEIWVLWVVLAFGGSCLEGLHLTINELCRSDESSGSDDVKGGVYRHDGESGYGNCTDNGGSV